MTRRRPRGDDGQLLLLIAIYALIAAALVVVAVDASAFFLSRRALASLADGAAVAGTRAENAGALYAGGSRTELPLSVDGVRQEVTRYIADRDAITSYPGLQILDASTDGGTVTVMLSEDKPLPFLPLVSKLTGAFPDGTVRITVVARARAPISAD